MPPVRALSVAVLVELERGRTSGGHVKCWERLAEAAADRSDVDLTVYVLGQRYEVDELGPSARFVALPAVLPARRLTGAIGGVDATDLAPFHPALARHLRAHDVWHLTHEFSFGLTAVRSARGAGVPLVASVHTDVPALAAAYVDELTGRLPAPVRGRLEPLAASVAVARLARRRRDRLLRACRCVLASSDADRAELARVVGAERVGRLRRGVDRGRFGPPTPERARRAEPVGLRDDEVAVLFAGRVDASKRALLAGQAVRQLRDEGLPVRLVVAGHGADEPRLAGLLGDGVRLLGHLPQDRLAAVYARCAALVFPSLSETVGNVVAEAMACGLPAVLPAGARTAQWLADPGRDGVLVEGDSPRDWADALRPLVVDPGRRAALGAAAAHTSASRHPSWADVVEEDLVPVWREAGRAGPAPAVSG